jgi:hypothetical protein
MPEVMILLNKPFFISDAYLVDCFGFLPANGLQEQYTQDGNPFFARGSWIYRVSVTIDQVPKDSKIRGQIIAEMLKSTKCKHMLPNECRNKPV